MFIVFVNGHDFLSECRDGETGQQHSAGTGGAGCIQTADGGRDGATETGQQFHGHTTHFYVYDSSSS